MRPAIPTPCASAKKKAAVTIGTSRRLVRKIRTWVKKVYWNDTIAAPATSTGHRAETLASIPVSSRKPGGALGAALAVAVDRQPQADHREDLADVHGRDGERDGSLREVVRRLPERNENVDAQRYHGSRRLRRDGNAEHHPPIPLGPGKRRAIRV